MALESFRIGNRGRLSLCEALRVLGETRLYFDLGYPSLAAYADSFFQLRRTETFEYVRVAQALVELTELRQALGDGGIAWSAVRAITRVAKVESQRDWIEFARRHGIEGTLAEARDALRRGGDRPRKGAFGLPNLDQKLVLRFSRSEMERVRVWIDAACALVAEKLGAEQVSVEQALLFLSESHAMSGAGEALPPNEPGCDDPGTARSSSSRPSTRVQVVYQRCPDCRRAAMATVDGFVEVATEEAARQEGCAEAIVIDGPTPPALRRRILAREGGRCGNPRCHHRAHQCHHIVFRSRGGTTDLSNEIAVCATCHALVHAGLLLVEGSAEGQLRWRSAASTESPERIVVDCGTSADRLPVLQLTQESTENAPRNRSDRSLDEFQLRSGVSDLSSNSSNANGPNLEDLAAGLGRLGFGVTRSRELIHAAARSLPPEQRTEANVLRAALSAG